MSQLFMQQEDAHRDTSHHPRQALADAYYVLRDPTRRKEYDSLRGTRSRSERTADPTSSANFFANFADFFSGPNAPAGSGGAGSNARGSPQRPDAEGVFGDVFEEVSFRYSSCSTKFSDSPLLVPL